MSTQLVEKVNSQEQYSGLKGLISALFINPERRLKFMACFSAYFDGSGSPDEGKALVVAGYLTSADQWLEFEREWNECLDNEGVSSFHMRDFAHSLRQFESWKGDEFRRRHFLERIIRITKMRVRKSIANAVILADFNRVNSEYMFSEHFGPPYALCGFACMKDVFRWATKPKRQYEFPDCIFENGDKHKMELIRLVERFEDWPTPIFKPKGRDFRPFEAADLVAWENRKFYTQATESAEFVKIRRSFQELQEIAPAWRVYTETELRRMVEKFQVPKREKHGNE